MTILLEKQDLGELLRLNKVAQEMPVMCLSLADGLAGKDFASIARDRLRDKWDELGKKYGFNPTATKGISRTGEVLF